MNPLFELVSDWLFIRRQREKCPAMAKKLEEFILSKGGSDEADTLYKQFRGRMPGVDALLRGRGLQA